MDRTRSCAASPSDPARRLAELRAHRLGGVLEHRQPQLAQLRERGRQPEQVDGHDRLGAGVSAARTVSAVTLRVCGSTSQNTGLAPKLATASAVA